MRNTKRDSITSSQLLNCNITGNPNTEREIADMMEECYTERDRVSAALFCVSKEINCPITVEVDWNKNRAIEFTVYKRVNIVDSGKITAVLSLIRNDEFQITGRTI